MSRIISGTIWGLAVAAMAAFSAIPAAASTDGGSNSPHIVLVKGGVGGGGGGGHGFGGGGGGGSHSFGGGNFSGGRSFSPAISGTRSFNGNAQSFANGNRNSFYRGNVGFDGYNRGGWNNGNWAWRGNGFYGGWGRGWGGWWGYPLGLWLGGYGWWYPGYYGYDYGPYDYYDNGYAYADTAAVPQSYTAVEPQQESNQTASEGQGGQYLDEAIQSFQSGDYRNAMRMAEHAIVDSPRDAEAHEVVALAAMANKDYRTAATEAHAVIALGGVPSWNQVFAIYQNADAYTSQLRALEDYVKAHPKSAEGQFLLGVQYLTTGYSSDAHEHLATASELTPKDKIAQDLVKGGGGEEPSTANRPGGAATK